MKPVDIYFLLKKLYKDGTILIIFGGMLVTVHKKC